MGGNFTLNIKKALNETDVFLKVIAKWQKAA